MFEKLMLGLLIWSTSTVSYAEISWGTSNNIGNQFEGVITDVVVTTTQFDHSPMVLITVRNGADVGTIRYSKEHVALGAAAASGIGKKAHVSYLGDNRLQLIFQQR